MNKKDYKIIGPFKGWVLENFPFIEADFDAITSYQLWCKVVEYLNKVIYNEALLEEQSDELVDAFNNLKNYVDNYFNNLDVQEEIDNKLDEMVESGTLQEIVANYLNAKAVFGFDNVASMKVATNLINGSYAETLGYYSKNDGGNALYKIREVTNSDTVDEMLIISLSDENLVAELIYDSKLDVKKLGVYGDNTHDDTTKIQYIFNHFIDKHVYFPYGTYLISSSISVPVTNYCYIELDSKAEIKATSSMNEMFRLTTSASYFTFDGGILNANSLANYCINSISDTNKYAPTYKNIFFQNALLSCFISKDPSHTSGSEHGWINNCKCYNTSTLATGLEIYGGDYVIESSEIFYTNVGIKSGTIITVNDVHIWAGGDANSNDDTIGILQEGSRGFFNNIYFDGMNTCIDTGTKASTITANNILDFLPNEAVTNKPMVINTRIASRILLSNLDINSVHERVYKIHFKNLDLGSINNQLVNISSVFEQYGGSVTYPYNQVDYGNCIFNDVRNFKSLYKAYSGTLENNKYYKVGYVVLRNSGVTGANLTFCSDDINKYSQDIFFTLYLNNGEVTVQSHYSKYNSGAVGRIGVAVGDIETITGISGETIYACPIYLHIIDSVGNNYGISVTSKAVNSGNWVSFFPANKFNNTGITSPTLLFDDYADTE